MDRRNFLFGTVATAASAAGLLLKAPADAVELFKPTVGDILAVSRVPQRDWRIEPIDIGETLYNARGNKVCQVLSVSWERQGVETTAFGDAASAFVPGIGSVNLGVQMLLAPGYSRGLRR